MNVRLGNNDDIPACVAMGEHFHAQTAYTDVAYDNDSAAHMLAMSVEQGLLVVAEHDGALVGFCFGLSCGLPFNAAVKTGTELAWWIEPAHRKGRVALQMLALIEDAARAAGCKYWSMAALEAVNPERAETIYLRAGYRPTERNYTRAF